MEDKTIIATITLIFNGVDGEIQDFEVHDRILKMINEDSLEIEYSDDPQVTIWGDNR